MTSSNEGNLYEYANGTLRNRFGITDAEALKRIEATLTAIRATQLEAQPLRGPFDLNHLRAIHRFLFQDVYIWAGELRQVDIFKDASRFAHYAFLEEQANKLFSQLAAERHLRDLPTEQWTTRASYYLGELNALHPFREGNGRTQRAFFSALAREAGYRLRWDLISAERMVEASIRSLFTADNADLEAIFREILSPLGG
jgi:cell filamentation protein